MTIGEFKQTSLGAVIASALSDPIVRAEMSWAPDRVAPLRVLNGPLGRGKVKLGKTERQHVGRWVAAEMRELGFAPRPGTRHQFSGTGPLSTGAFYDRVEPVPADPAERWARVRSLVAALGEVGTVNEFLQDKREAAAREDEQA